MKKISFLGLGVMGFHMAGHLANAGFKVSVYNRTLSKSKDWLKKFKGEIVQTPAQAGENADVVIACLCDDDSVRQVALSDQGVFSTMEKSTLFIDHTTASSTLAVELAKRAKQLGFSFIDAPVSGGEIGAEKGKLTIMVGGDNDDYQKALPYLQCYGDMVKHIGAIGTGQIAKMVNQICIAGLIQGLSEGIHFGLKNGLDMKVVLEVMSKGAASSWQMQNRGQTMLDNEFDFGFAIDLMRKDLAICFSQAQQFDVELPVTKIVDNYYKELQQLNGGRWDTSSLIKRLTHHDKLKST